MWCKKKKMSYYRGTSAKSATSYESDDDLYQNYSYERSSSAYSYGYATPAASAAATSQGVSFKLKPFVSQIVGYLATTPELVPEKVEEIQPHSFESRFRTLVVDSKIAVPVAINTIMTDILKNGSSFRDYLFMAADCDSSPVDPSIRWHDAFKQFIKDFGFYTLECVDDTDFLVLEDAFKDLLMPLREDIRKGRVY